MSFAHRTRVRCLVLCAASFVAVNACGDTAPQAPGTVVVNFSTNQGDENLFVWGVSVDGASPHTVGSNETGKFDIEGVPAGEHHLIASSLPSPCSSGADNRTVTVPSNDTLRVTFAVKCTRSTGDIALVVATSGTEFDLDGYRVIVDGIAGPTVAAATASSVTLPKLAPGAHEVTLTGLATNCSVAAGSAHTASVLAGQAASLLISVGCVTTNGTIRVVAASTTSGITDPDGYLVTVGTAAIVAVANNGSVDVAVKAGTYDVTLSDIEPSCTVPAKKQTVTVAESQTTTATFNLTCGAYPATVAGLTAADPASDTLVSRGAGPVAFDILSVNTRYASTFMTVTLKFAGPVAGLAMRGYIDFDLDEDPATGVRPVVNDTVVGGSATQGSDRFIYFEFGNAAGLFSVETGTGSFINMIGAGDSILFVMPFDKLLDDGNLTITTVIGTAARPMDYAPNTGVLVSHVPAVASMSPSAAYRPSRSAPTAAMAARTYKWRPPPR